MTTEVTVICDGCGNPFVEAEERIQINAMEVDTGQGITSAPVMLDYHPGCLPGPAMEAIGYKHGNLVGEIIPGREDPLPPRES